MSVWDVPGQVFRPARKVEDIFRLQEETKAARRVIDQRRHELERRMTRLDAEQGQLITEAEPRPEWRPAVLPARFPAACWRMP